MKNTIKLSDVQRAALLGFKFCAIAFVVMGFVFTACSGGGDLDENENEYEYVYNYPDLSGDIVILHDYDVDSYGVPIHTELTAYYNGPESVQYVWGTGIYGSLSAATSYDYLIVSEDSAHTPTYGGVHFVTVSADGYNSKTANIYVHENQFGNVIISPDTKVTIDTELTASYNEEAEHVQYIWVKEEYSNGVNGFLIAEGTHMESYFINKIYHTVVSQDSVFVPTEVGTYCVWVNTGEYTSYRTYVYVTGPNNHFTGDISVSPGTNVIIGTELTAYYSGSESVQYTWLIEKGDNLSFFNGSVFTPTSAGTYFVQVSAEGYDTLTSHAIYVTDLTGTISITPNTNVTTGTVLTANYTGAGSVSYQWKKDGVNIGTNSRYYNTTEAGSYTVTVSVQNYSETSNAVIVTGDTIITSLSSLSSYLASATSGYSVNDPIGIKLNITISSYSSTISELVSLLNSAKRYVKLDFSGRSSSETADFSFSYCTYIVGIIMPNGVTSIGSYAFYNCTSLTSVIIGNSVTSIGSYAFQNCSNLASISIPDSVTSIGNYAFQNCSNLASVIIPDSVTSIGEYAFDGCSNLASVTIGNSVTSIGICAFRNCSSLTSVTIPGSVTSWDRAFGAWGDTDNQNSGLVNVIISDGVTNIGDRTFYRCNNLTSVIIGNSVTSIGYRAFSGCTSLASVTIGNSVTSIENYAFSGCTSLTSVTIPDSVTSIGNWAFFGTSLVSVTIPPSVTSWGDYAFASSGLTSVTISDGVKSIGNYAFNACTSLTSVTIPNSVTSIGEWAFNYCTSLVSVTIPDNITSWDGAFAGSGLTSVTIPSSITRIPDYAFYGCTSLVSVTIPDSVTIIRNYAFYGCTSLVSVIIPDSVTSIGAYAFYNCTNLVSVIFEGYISNPGGYVLLDSGGTNFYSPFNGDLREKYLAEGGGIGTYTRPGDSYTWTKQE